MEPSVDKYMTLAAAAEGSFRDRGSRFLAYAFPVDTEEDFRQELERLRKTHRDARHHCYAFRLSPAGNVFRYSDDGEPSGTAGRPIYEQLLSAGVYDAAVVVVRYFGGILLGTGGLHKAYKQAAADALSRTEKREKIIETALTLRFGYPQLNRVMQILDREKIPVVAQDFGTSCTITVRLPASRTEAFTGRLQQYEHIYVEKA